MVPSLDGPLLLTLPKTGRCSSTLSFPLGHTCSKFLFLFFQALNDPLEEVFKNDIVFCGTEIVGIIIIIIIIRSEICAPKQPPAPNLPHEHICGRPLGLRFEKKTGDLWIADGYLGILKVGPEGGQAEPVLTEIDGIPLRFCNDLDFDHDGVLYFTDSSTRWARRCKFDLLCTFQFSGMHLKLF